MLVAAGEILGAGVDRQEPDPAAEPPQTLSPEQDAAIARMVFNALDAGVLVQGPRGRIATANPAAARILGVELDDSSAATRVTSPARCCTPTARS